MRSDIPKPAVDKLLHQSSFVLSFTRQEIKLGSFHKHSLE